MPDIPTLCLLFLFSPGLFLCLVQPKAHVASKIYHVVTIINFLVNGMVIGENTMEREMYQLKDMGEVAVKRILFHCPDYKKTTKYFNVCNWPFKYSSFSPAFAEIHQEVLGLKGLNC
jgi:hypothetical protein